jgi:hypothetical protein
MTLENINKRWISYKTQYGLDSPVLIEEVRFDGDKGIDASFDITEMYTHHYVLHLNPKIHLYRSDYVDMILWHEFTHLYDFLEQPFAYKVMRKIYLYMNTYSEYHAARRTLERVLFSNNSSEIRQNKDTQHRSSQSGATSGKIIQKGFSPDKCIIPTAFKEISLRNLVSDTLRHAERAHAWFVENPDHQSFHLYLRYVMYLMGYASLFANKKDILKFCLADLHESEDLYMELFKILEEKDFFKIVSHMDEIYDEVGIK